jgi:hypothetical protein
VTNVLQGFGRRLDALPGDVVAAAAPMVSAVAERHGGRFAGEYLTARIDRRKVSDSAASAVVVAEPGRQWSWREYGIEDHSIRPKRRRAMAGGLDHPIMGPVIHPGVPADESWSEAMDEVATEFASVVDRVMDRVAG